MPNGLRLVKTPGHTLGSMSIVVPSADGPRIITGDTPHKIYALFPQMTTNMCVDGTVLSISPAPESRHKVIFRNRTARRPKEEKRCQRSSTKRASNT